MKVPIKGLMEYGGKGITIDVECHISNGLPNIIIVGFANKAIDEAKERLRSSFANSKLDMPRKRITLNLAPADIPKESTSFDVAMAAAILGASGQIDTEKITDAIFLGELGLDGKVRAVRGIIGKLIAGRNKGFRNFYIPADNLRQAQLVPGITLIPIRELRDLYLDLSGTVPNTRVNTDNTPLPDMPESTTTTDFTDVVGQVLAKRALEIAAAGGHNILMSGPPGTGKSMLAKAVPSILPPLQLEEMLEVTHLHSLADKQYDQIITERPFRSPHHSSSDTSILGGGTHPKPGEISLSHHGVLFFDEFPEFSRSTLEALRQPLEDRVITVARARDTITFPANFMLVATSNPCPCGYYGTQKACSCLPSQIVNYQRKLSGPIIDRIDLYVEVDEVKHATLLAKSTAETSETIRNRVIAARERQTSRYKDPQVRNSNLNNRQIKQHIKITTPAKEILNQAAERLGLSARSYMKTLKVAQTIADLDGASEVDIPHITEALQYRRQVRS